MAATVTVVPVVIPVVIPVVVFMAAMMLFPVTPRPVSTTIVIPVPVPTDDHRAWRDIDRSRRHIYRGRYADIDTNANINGVRGAGKTHS